MRDTEHEKEISLKENTTLHILNRNIYFTGKKERLKR